MITDPWNRRFYLGRFTSGFRGSLAEPRGFFTTARWSIFCSGGRFGLAIIASHHEVASRADLALLAGGLGQIDTYNDV